MKWIPHIELCKNLFKIKETPKWQEYIVKIGRKEETEQESEGALMN